MSTGRRNASLPTIKIVTDQTPQPQKATLALPAKAQPGRSRSKWGILVQSKPEAELFAMDEQRSIQAYNELVKLAAETGVGDKGFETLETCRTSAYFFGLKNKIEKKEKLVLSEYLYYALTTDDVNTVSIELLEAATKLEDYHGFQNNLQVLLTARKWQEAKDPEEKTALNIKLRKDLTHRGFHHREGSPRCEYYLNLHGINLAGAELNFVSLDFTDLGDANLSSCNLGYSHIMYSNLNHANLSNAHAHSPGQSLTESLTKIEHTIAMDANFDGFKSDNISLKNSDFTGSTFTNADISIGISHDHDATVTFDFVDFNGSNVHFVSQREIEKHIFTNLRFANLTNCRIGNADYNRIDCAGAIMLPLTAFSDHQQFKLALEQAMQRFTQSSTIDEISQKVKDARLLSMKQCIATILLAQLDELALNTSEKIDLINIALQPQLLGRAASILPVQIGSLFNSVSTTLFGPAKTEDNSSAGILEKELNQLSKPVHATGIAHTKH